MCHEILNLVLAVQLTGTNPVKDKMEKSFLGTNGLEIHKRLVCPSAQCDNIKKLDTYSTSTKAILRCNKPEKAGLAE